MGPMKPGSAAGGLAYALGARHAQRTGHAGQLLRLDGIQFMIAADHQRHHVAVAAVDQQGLDAARRRARRAGRPDSAMVRAFGVATLRQRLRWRRRAARPARSVAAVSRLAA